MFVGCWLLIVVCCVCFGRRLFVVCCLVFGVCCCLLFLDCCCLVLVVGYCLACVGCSLLRVLCYLLFPCVDVVFLIIVVC